MDDHIHGANGYAKIEIWCIKLYTKNNYETCHKNDFQDPSIILSFKISSISESKFGHKNDFQDPSIILSFKISSISESKFATMYISGNSGSSTNFTEPYFSSK